MVVFLGREETGVPGENLSVQRREPTNPHMTPDLGIEPGPHWWEASALTTAPSLHPGRYWLDKRLFSKEWRSWWIDKRFSSILKKTPKSRSLGIFLVSELVQMKFLKSNKRTKFEGCATWVSICFHSSIRLSSWNQSATKKKEFLFSFWY